MKSKAPLMMLEQMVMILVFALAAALCLQAFVLSDNLSRRGEEQDRAAALCQNAAETLRAAGFGGEKALDEAADRLGGQRDGDLLEVWYDGDWQVCDGPGSYKLTVFMLPAEVPGLCSARLRLTGEDGGELFTLEKVSWQEVD